MHLIVTDDFFLVAHYDGLRRRFRFQPSLRLYVRLRVKYSTVRHAGTDVVTRSDTVKDFGCGYGHGYGFGYGYRIRLWLRVRIQLKNSVVVMDTVTGSDTIKDLGCG